MRTCLEWALLVHYLITKSSILKGLSKADNYTQLLFLLHFFTLNFQLQILDFYAHEDSLSSSVLKSMFVCSGLVTIKGTFNKRGKKVQFYHTTQCHSPKFWVSLQLACQLQECPLQLLLMKWMFISLLYADFSVVFNSALHLQTTCNHGSTGPIGVSLSCTVTSDPLHLFNHTTQSLWSHINPQLHDGQKTYCSTLEMCRTIGRWSVVRVFSRWSWRQLP